MARRRPGGLPPVGAARRFSSRKPLISENSATRIRRSQYAKREFTGILATFLSGYKNVRF